MSDVITDLPGFTGTLIRPDSAGYDEARAVFNGMIDRRPALIARCASTADVVAAIELSRATYRKMLQNLAWATGYNLVAIPVAAGVLVPWGFDLPMAIGAIARFQNAVMPSWPR